MTRLSGGGRRARKWEKPHEVNLADLLYSELIAAELLRCQPHILHVRSDNGPVTHALTLARPRRLLTPGKHAAEVVAANSWLTKK